MRKALLIVLALSASITSEAFGDTRFGFLVGPRYSRVEINRPGVSGDWSASFSGFVEWAVNQNVSMVFGVGLARTSYEETFVDLQGPRPDVVATTSIDYASFPLLLKFRRGSDAFAPYVELGPRFDLRLNTEQGLFYFGPGIALLPSYTSEFIADTILGASVGVGAEFWRGRILSLLTEVRANFDFSEISDSPGLEINRSSIDLLVGLAF